MMQKTERQPFGLAVGLKKFGFDVQFYTDEASEATSTRN